VTLPRRHRIASWASVADVVRIQSVPPSIRRLAPDEWAAYRVLRLRALEESPDAFGSTLAHERDRPDAEWASRLAPSSSDLPLVAELAGEAVGLAWGKIDATLPDTARLYQMWVAPAQRGLGVGRMLVDAAIEWAKASQMRRLALCVTCGDTAAMRLYARAGFRVVGEPFPLRAGSELLARSMELDLAHDGAASG
jgi:ribosomal protein S18 acetylase RimI-like enzyme